MEVAHRLGEHPLDHSPEWRPEAARTRQTVEKVKARVRDIGDQAREQASAAGDVLYRQGQRTGEYLTQNVNEYDRRRPRPIRRSPGSRLGSSRPFHSGIDELEKQVAATWGNRQVADFVDDK